MVSLGMFTLRALSTAARSRGLALTSPPPSRAEIRQLLDDLGPDLRLLGVRRLLLVLDLGPPVMAGHGRFLPQTESSRRRRAGRRRQRRAVPGVARDRTRSGRGGAPPCPTSSPPRRRPSRRSSTRPRRRCIRRTSSPPLARPSAPMRASTRTSSVPGARRRILALVRVVARRHDQRVRRRAPASPRAGRRPLGVLEAQPRERTRLAAQVAQLDVLLRRLGARRRSPAPR